MCGITGILNPPDQHVIHRMTKRIRHRGPDHIGFYHFENLDLGHVRLSILDTTANAHQPFTSPDGRFTVVFNGEIYNHLELRKPLVTKYQFSTTSDTETLLYSFMEYGESIVEKLNGMFAFVILDKHLRKLYMARDRFGIKPLYLYQKDKIVAFSSEIKSFLEIPGVDKTLNHNALSHYIRFQYQAGNETPFTHVEKLPKASILTFDLENGKKEIKAYYKPSFEKRNFTLAQAKNELNYLLEKSVKAHHLSDVPIRYLLSGGIDSSTILHYSMAYNEDVQAYSIKDADSKKEGFDSDIFFARQVAEQLNIPLHEATPSGVSTQIDRMMYSLDEPISDTASLSMAALCELAQQHGTKVLLSGSGADDIFSGYRRHQALAYQKYKPILSFIPISFLSGNLARRIEKLKGTPWSYYAWLSADITSGLFQSNISTVDPFEEDWKKYSLEKLDKMLRLEQEYYLPDNNLLYMDKIAMSYGIEMRVPFLNNELVNFANALPTSLKMKGNQPKYLLRDVMKSTLPACVIKRSKTGFGYPIRHLIKNDTEKIVENYLLKGPFSSRNIFNQHKVAELISQNKKGKIDASYPIWSLICIESWLRQFVD